ncbi:MAG: iron export ABC transporter permease subunit FetB [Pirellulales bacterium]|nr:iron export ABC transporter permease subunit FetB [Pirellulales bacterium]
MQHAQDLSFWQVAIAASLILINGAISVVLQLGLEKRLMIAASRTVVQLLLVGLVLDWVFDLHAWYAMFCLALMMSLIAGGAAVRRADRRWSGIWIDTMLCILLSSWFITGIALTAVVRIEPWYKPQYAVPLLGMILGNTLNGISIGLDRLGSELTAQRDRVEMLLSLGATRWEAAREPVATAIRAGMTPIINSMTVVGIVSLPGMMTGQLLEGGDPARAVRYQIVIMFLIGSGTALGTVGVVLAGFRRLFNARHQFVFPDREMRK